MFKLQNGAILRYKIKTKICEYMFKKLNNIVEPFILNSNRSYILKMKF
jgi:hypothetical protein